MIFIYMNKLFKCSTPVLITKDEHHLFVPRYFVFFPYIVLWFCKKQWGLPGGEHTVTTVGLLPHDCKSFDFVAFQVHSSKNINSTTREACCKDRNLSVVPTIQDKSHDFLFKNIYEWPTAVRLGILQFFVFISQMTSWMLEFTFYLLLEYATPSNRTNKGIYRASLWHAEFYNTYISCRT